MGRDGEETREGGVATPAEWAASRVRDAVHRLADGLRRTAADLDRIGADSAIDKIPGDVAHTLAWGIANARTDGPAMWFREYLVAKGAE